MKEHEIEVMLATLKAFRKRVSNARCLADTPKQAYELTGMLDAADEFINCLTKYLQ